MAASALLPVCSRCEECGDSGDDHGLYVPVSAIWVVCLTVFIDSLGGSISAPVLPFYAIQFGVSDGAVGSLFSAFSVAQVVALPFIGMLSDCFGRRRVLVWSLAGAALGAFAQGGAPTFSALLAARFFSGVWAAVGSTANVYVCDVTTKKTRGIYLGYLMSSNGLAFAFGPGLGGGLSQLGLNVPIITNGVLCVAAGLWAFFYLPESPTFARLQVHTAKEPWWRNLSWGFIIVCVVEFFRGLAFSSIFALVGVFMFKVWHLNSLKIGFAVCSGALTLIFTNVFVSPRLQGVLGDVAGAVFGLLCIAAGLCTLSCAPYLSLSLFGMCLTYSGQAVAGCLIATITSTLCTDSNRGALMSMQQTAQACGRVVGPIFLGKLSESNARLPFTVAAIAAALAGLLLLTLSSGYGSDDEHSLPASLECRLTYSPRSSQRQTKEEYTEDDVLELGRYLCELLTEGHYQWKSPEQRQALKQMLRVCFPPRDGDIEDLRQGSKSLHAPPSALLAVPQNPYSDDTFRQSPDMSTERCRRKARSLYLP